MSGIDQSGVLLHQLSALCEAHPYAPKYVFVPRVQHGRAVEDGLLRQRGGWAGLQCLIPRHFAERIARSDIRASGRTEMPVGGQRFLAAHLLNREEAVAALDGLPASHHFADTIGQTIDTLRLGGVSVKDVRERAAQSAASEALQAVAHAYAAYLAFLDEHSLYDDADVFRWATERVQRGEASEAAHAVFAVCNGTDLPERSYQFLQALREEAPAFYRVGGPRAEGAPSYAAAALFSDASPPAAAEPDSDPAGQRRFRRAVGAYNEVRALFRDVLNDEVPLDEAEIAYTEGDPYLSLIADLADRLDIPVSIGTGLPGRLTRTGQALRGWYDWVTNDFDMAIIIRLLRNGHLRLDRMPDPDAGPALAPHEAATLLASRRYEPGRTGYRRALGVAIDDASRRIDNLEERGLDPSDRERERDRLQRLRDMLDDLADLAPRQTSVQAMARGSQRFLERFGPVDPPPEDKPETERTMDEAARAVIWQKLDTLTRLPFRYRASAKHLATLLRDWVGRQYVRAEHPRPGAVHVLPLESVGYSGRPHVYAVGFDSETLTAPAADDLALRAADRKALSVDLEGTLPDRTAAADEALWRTLQALRRHRGPLTLYARVFDIENGEERYPASLFLQVEREAQGDHASDGAAPVVGFLPTEDDGVVLTDAEAWLQAYAARGTVDGGCTARQGVKEQFPWMVDGEAGRRARAAEVYTLHDGLLAPGDYPELDFLDSAYKGGRFSAGRLETLAETPYLYFLKYVLGVRPLDEPALDDEPWFNHKRRGTLLHRTFADFMASIDGEAVSEADEPVLYDVLDAALQEEVERHAPPSDVTERAARRQLRRDARLFLHAEIEHTARHEPLHHELGFGFGPFRRRDGDLGAAEVPIGKEATLSLRGRIDRVDRRADGTLAIWDYKTGSTKDFDESDPLKQGAKLQWAVYAYALETLVDEAVTRSGYFFTSVDAMGERLAFAPDDHRTAAQDLIRALARMAQAGGFPMNPRARYIGRWKWDGYQRIVSDLEARSRELTEKDYPPERLPPPFFE